MPLSLPLPKSTEALCHELNLIHGRLFDLANHQSGPDRGNVAGFLHEAANQIIHALNCQERGNNPNEPIPMAAIANAVGGMDVLTNVLKDILTPDPATLDFDPIVDP